MIHVQHNHLVYLVCHLLFHFASKLCMWPSDVEIRTINKCNNDLSFWIVYFYFSYSFSIAVIVSKNFLNILIAK